MSWQLYQVATMCTDFMLRAPCLTSYSFRICVGALTPTQRVALALLGPPQGSMRDLERRKDRRADYSNK